MNRLTRGKNSIINMEAWKMKLNKYVGLVIDSMVITGVEKYFDLSTGREEKCFIVNDKYGVNCELFINQYM